MREKPMRVALIGAGAIAQTHSMALERSTSTQLVCVVDPLPRAARSVAVAHDAKTCADVDEMLSSVDVEAAIVCTPPASHGEICLQLLSRGIHVLCEKPLAISLDQARSMFEASETNGCKLTMASKFRFVEDVRRAKSIIESGIIGDVVLFENAFTANVNMRNRWNSDPAIAGGGVLIDNGTHSVDILRWLLGPLAGLRVVEGRRLQELEVEDTVKMFVRTTSGVMGDIDLSWSIDKRQPAYIYLYGSEGTVMIGWKESKYRRSQDSEWTLFGSGYDKVQAFVSQNENFVNGIRGTEELVVQPEDAIASVAVVDTAYAALRDSRWHAIPPAWESVSMP